MTPEKLSLLRKGVVIPAHPLALTARRKLDERRQRALTRYYLAAGAGGLAVGVHTTQFAIREKGLLKPVLELASEEEKRHKPLTLKIAGICGRTKQATAEAALARDFGYDIGLLSLAALKNEAEDKLIAHADAVGKTIPLFGFYMQPAVGGRVLPYSFWRRFVEIPSVVGIKIAPFNRYQTLDVLRAVAESGRADEIALYTGNDDNILLDLLIGFRFGDKRLRIVGGLLGHWSVWTRRAVELLNNIREPNLFTQNSLSLAAEITDANAAFFDAANGFRGCIAGLHEVLRRQGLLKGIWCLDPKEGLSPGQKAEIDRVYKAYPILNDDTFIEQYRDLWLA
jgi:dihydrodipicolinate synthase/N-acetylneuraminate lyase